MSATILRSEGLEVVFGENPLVVEAVVHRASGEVVCRGGRQTFLLRPPGAPSDPVFLDRLERVEASASAVAFTVADAGGKNRAACRIEAAAEGLRFALEVETDGPAWLAEWRLAGLDLDEVIVPALGGQALTADMPADTEVAYKYPFWWSAPFVLGSVGEAGGLWLRTQDPAPHYRLLRVRKVEDREEQFSLGLGFEADAPLVAPRLSAAWYLDGYAGPWTRPVDAYRAWMEDAFGLVPYRDHPHFPAWAGDVDFVLELWGMSKEAPEPLHTFADMEERVRAFAALHAPERTLLYLVGFAEHGIDSNIPEYGPSERLGGPDAFRRLVATAHGLGYRVMIHTNVLGMAYTHPLFERFRRHQVVDPFGRPMGWGNDLDGDWLAEPFFAYINPGAPEWGDLMEAVLGALIRDYGLDAVFLDQTLLAFNNSTGPNFLEGMRRHVERLQRAFPGVLFAGEGQHEQTLAALPVAQIHGLDSIAGIHGMEGRLAWRRVHPVYTHLFGPYTRFVAHLLTRHPSSPTFLRQEAAYAELGVVPALVLYRRSQPLDTPALHRMLRRVRASRTPNPTPT